MLHIAIVEDDENSSVLLQNYVKKYFDDNGDKCKISVFKDGLDFISDYTGDYNIIFMDIEMPHLNGMQTAKKLRAVDSNVTLIFVTNMAKYALKGYEVDALDFMVKPVDYFNFSLKMDKAVRIQKRYNNEAFCIETEDGIVKLTASEIRFVETDGHFVIYHTEKGDHRVRASMRDTEVLLIKFGFVRCNSSFMVNLSYVTKTNGDVVEMGQDKLAISRSRKKAFIEALMAFYGNGGMV